MVVTPRQFEAKRFGVKFDRVVEFADIYVLIPKTAAPYFTLRLDFACDFHKPFLNARLIDAKITFAVNGATVDRES